MSMHVPVRLFVKRSKTNAENGWVEITKRWAMNVKGIKVEKLTDNDIRRCFELGWIMWQKLESRMLKHGRKKWITSMFLFFSYAIHLELILINTLIKRLSKHPLKKQKHELYHWDYFS